MYDLIEDRDEIERRALDWAKRMAERHHAPVTPVEMGPWRWRLVLVKSRLELKIREQVRKMFGRSMFTPVKEVTVKRSKRLSAKQRKDNAGRTELRAVFSGYLFATEHDLMEVDFSRVPGVYGVHCIAGQVAKIPEYVIARLRSEANADGVIVLDNDPDNLPIERGAVVRVLEGPFRGFPGVIDTVLDARLDESRKVCVHMTLFGQTTPVWFDVSQIEVVARSHPDCSARPKP